MSAPTRCESGFWSDTLDTNRLDTPLLQTSVLHWQHSWHSGVWMGEHRQHCYCAAAGVPC
eukprot:178186-Prorocentrum_lima.AAC.1